MRIYKRLYATNLSVLYGVQSKFVCEFSTRHCIRQILLVGEHKERGISKLVLLQLKQPHVCQSTHEITTRKCQCITEITTHDESV